MNGVIDVAIALFISALTDSFDIPGPLFLPLERKTVAHDSLAGNGISTVLPCVQNITTYGPFLAENVCQIRNGSGGAARRRSHVSASVVGSQQEAVNTFSHHGDLFVGINLIANRTRSLLDIVKPIQSHVCNGKHQTRRLPRLTMATHDSSTVFTRRV